MPPRLAGRFVPILTVRDVVASASWYCEVLGLVVQKDWADETGRVREVTLRHPDTGLDLALVDHDANPGDAFSEMRTGLDHLELVVPERSDLDAWEAHLDSLRVAHSGVKQPHYTRNAMLTFRDPDNIQLELFWAAPPT